ncbi:MAG: TetR/AcrR family transcriptional regulator [Actinobacteria bacterium]|nr:TetR/AcrR family transcriptional regulator [Actinomycetota bacterium]
MASNTRTAMIDAAIRLLAEDGYQATSFTEVLARSGAPRGSIYHHFPGGKDELVAAALDLHVARTFERLDALSGQSAEAVAIAFLDGWRRMLVVTGFQMGCSLLAVTVSAGEGPLRARAGAHFRDWRALLARLLTDAGVEPGRAAAFAAQLLAATEGAVAIARAERSIEPFDLVAGGLLAEAAALTAARR